MFKLAVVDDDPLLREAVRASVARYFASAGIDTWSLTDYANAEAFWHCFADERPDIVFFDIRLPGENGLAAARRLYAIDKRPVIVFITSYPDFAVQGYGINAAGFLLKPFDDAQIGEIMRVCAERLNADHTHYLTVRSQNRQYKIDIATITHIESANRQVRIHTDDAVVDCGGKLDEYLERMAGSFLRVHKSFAVNRARVLAMGNTTAVLDNGAEVPISRSHRRQARDAFFSKLAGNGKGATL